MLNRSAILIRPTQPYIDWAKSLPDADSILPSLDGEQSVYLVEPIDDSKHLEAVLAEVFTDIFESELASWCLDESLWPQERTLTMFKHWFSIECHSCVKDLLDESLEDDGL